MDALVITGGGDVHPRYYVPDPAKNRDALNMDDVAALGCGSASHCRSTGAPVPFCGHNASDEAFRQAMGGPPGPDEVTTLDGRNVLTDPDDVLHVDALEAVGLVERGGDADNH